VSTRAWLRLSGGKARAGSDGGLEVRKERRPTLERSKRTKIRTIITSTCAALVFATAGPASAHDGEAEKARKTFEAAIPNILGNR